MTEKLTQAEVHYTTEAREPSERCGLCKSFRPMYQACAKVKATPKPIVKTGWCEKFERRAQSAPTPIDEARQRRRRRMASAANAR